MYDGVERPEPGPVPRRGDAPPRRGRVSAAAVLDTTSQGYLVFDGRMRVVLCNPQAARLLGLLHHAGRSSLPRLLQDSGTLCASAQLALSQAARAARRGDCPVDMQRIGGLQVSIRPLSPEASAASLAGAGNGAFWLISLASVQTGPGAPPLDALTGVAERGGFLEALGAMLADPPGMDGVTVLLVDLNGFRTINETVGATVADGLLQVVAQRLHAALRTGDLIGRVGGDQFAVATPGVPHPETMASRLLDQLGRPYLIEGQPVSLSASVGVATSTEEDDGITLPRRRAEALLHGASLALQQAKVEGQRTVRLYNPAMQAQAVARRRLEADLNAGLALQQFELHYQPQTALDTGALIGFEALLRWRHPQRGLVPPDAFIPTLESLGLIVQVGEWVLRTACQAAATWPGRLTVAVNVSAVQLMDRDRLPRAVASALRDSGLVPDRLELELTESAVARHADLALQVLQAVRAQGVSVSMDDFGIGYSSLSQLRRFPFDKIKIDRSFVRDLVADQASAEAGAAGAVAVVRAIAALGASLGLTTTAEGVETPEQQRLVRAEGCTNMQGFLVSRPIPEWEVAGLIAVLTQGRA